MRIIIDSTQAAIEACYARGEYYRNPAGQILNELGRIAKGRDIILRHPRTGYPLKRYSDLEMA